MTWDGKEKKTAFVVSVLLHGIVFFAVAVSGLFSYLQYRVETVTDVTVYDADALAGLSQGAGSSGDAGQEAMAYAAAPAPEIDETYTEAVNRQRQEQADVQNTTAASADAKSGVPATDAVRGKNGDTAAGKLVSPNSQGNGNGSEKGSGSSGSAGTGTENTGGGNGSGDGTGDGNGEGSGNGNGGGDSQVPARLAVLTYRAPAAYPEALRRKNVQGSVQVRMLIGPDGTVQSASVAISSGYAAMDESALQAAGQYLFAPAENAMGQSVSCYMSGWIRFSLK
jgi:protein TonB